MSSFETTLFRDGAWRTERVQIQPFLKEVAPAAQQEAPPKSPSCGVLTRTLVESPVTHWILPARLRSRRQNDVAFIGVSRSFTQHGVLKSNTPPSQAFGPPSNERKALHELHVQDVTFEGTLALELFI